MTSEEVEKIVKNLPDNMKDVLLNGLNDSIKAIRDVVKIVDKCKECRKDWTKCGRCPVTMEWLKEQKVRDK